MYISSNTFYNRITFFASSLWCSQVGLFFMNEGQIPHGPSVGVTIIIINVHVSVFSFLGSTFRNILPLCFLYLLFVEFMITRYE